MGWRCSNCSEQHEDVFDSCWNCGGTREGEQGGRFERATDPGPDGNVIGALVDHAEELLKLLPRKPKKRSDVRLDRLEAEVASLRAEVRALRNKLG